MKILDFNKKYNPDYLCEAKYLDASNRTVTGIVMLPPTLTHKKTYMVCIESMVNRIPLSRVISLTVSSRKWKDV